MPFDIAIIAPLDKRGKTTDQLRGTGFTEFVFEPYENDVQFDRAKKVRQMSGTEKLVQSIMRILLTTKGDSFEDPDWGSEMNGQIGSKMRNDNFATVRESIITALTHYNYINRDNPDSDEVINTIDEIQVVSDLNDPRVMRVVVGVTTESGIGVRVIAPQVEN
jgi:phage baseplate assembly protein W